MRIFEITRIPDYKEERDWSSFNPYWLNDDYEIHDQKGPMEVRIYDNQGLIRIVGLIDNQIMGYLTLMRVEHGNYKVQAVQVDSKYRGKGVAPYFYEVAILDLGLTVLSDHVQTKGGQGIWKKLIADKKFKVDTIDTATGDIVPADETYNRESIALRAIAA